MPSPVPREWSAYDERVGGATASITRVAASPGSSIIHYLTYLLMEYLNNTGAYLEVGCQVFDGAALIYSTTIEAPANTLGSRLAPVPLMSSPESALTIAFTAVAAAGTRQHLTAQGYSA